MRRGIVKVAVVVLAASLVLLGTAALFLPSLLVVPRPYDEVRASGPPPRLFPAQVGSRWGFIDSTGTMVVPLQFDGAEEFSEGLALVRLNGKVAYIDESGTVALRLDKAVDARAFSDGMAEVSEGNLWGYIDRSGTFVINPQFRWTSPFVEGIASVGKGVNDWFTIDKTGRPLSITPPDENPPETVEFREGLSICTLTNGLSGYIDHAGRWIIKPTFSGAGHFSEGLAPARPGGKRTKWGYIDKAGEWAIRPQFLQAGPFSEGLAPVRVFTFSFPPFKWGFIDKQGRLVIPPTYDGVAGFCDGSAFVEKEWRVGAIDRTGQIVIPLQFNVGAPYRFWGPLAPVIYSDRNRKMHRAYVNKQGQVVWASPNVVRLNVD